MKKRLFASVTASLIIVATSAKAQSPQEILKRADEIRNPSESYFMKVEAQDSEDGSEASLYEVYLKGNGKTLVKVLAPLRDRGRNMLMVNEDMWAYVPNLKRAVRVSLNQKLTGQAANGDLTRTRWSGDYEPTIEETEKEHWRLYLKALKKGLTYDRIRIWVHKKSFRPERAEFLSLSDKVLKKAEYRGFKMLANGERPSEIFIQDAVNTSKTTLLKVISMEVKDFPETLFHQNNLR